MHAYFSDIRSLRGWAFALCGGNTPLQNILP